MSLYQDVRDALGLLRHNLLRHRERTEDMAVVMPWDTIRAIEVSMPPEVAIQMAGRLDRTTEIFGIKLLAAEGIGREMEVLHREVRELRRRLARRDKRDQACAAGMARIMNAVPIADAVGAGETVETLVDYVVRRLEA